MLLAAGLGLAAILMYIYAHIYIIFAGIVCLTGLGIYIVRTRISAFYFLVFLIYPIMIARITDISKGMTYQGMLSEKEYTAEIRGRVASISSSQNGYTVVIRNASVIPHGWGNNIKAGIIIYSDECEFETGNVIHINAELSDFELPVNEGQFNSRRYYNSIGINYIARIKSIDKVEKRADDFSYIAGKLSDSIKNVYEKVYTDTNKGTMQSIILGDRTQLDRQTKDLYQKNGIAHILAISALHVSIVGLFVYRCLKKYVSVISAAVLSGIILFMYLCMTGNSVSAGRAVIMLVVFIIADVLGRTSDGANTLGLAAVILLFLNPYNIYNTGFWMSFLAMSGIIFVKPVLYNEQTILIFFNAPGHKKKSFCEVIALRLLNAFITGISVTAATLPVVLCQTGQLPVISLLLNMIVIPLMSIVMVSGIMTGIAGLITLKLAVYLAGASEYVLNCYNYMCDMASKSRMSVIVTGCPSALSVVVYVVLLVVICGFRFLELDRLIRINRKIKLLVALIYVIALIGLKHKRPEQIMATMLDVGQGDAIVVQGSRINMLFDGGSTSKKNVGRYSIYSYLKYCGVRKLDYIFVSHSDKDHISGIYELIELCDNTFEIGTIVMPETDGDNTLANLAGKAEDAGIRVAYSHKGQEVNSNGIRVKCMHPCKGYKYSSTNDSSAVYLVESDGFSMMMMGDASTKAEKCMLGDNSGIENVTILKAGHHGSKTSSSDELLDVLRPQMTLISCGKNNSYGHPHKETIQRLNKSGSEYLITMDEGEIVVEYKKGQTNVYTYRDLNS